MSITHRLQRVASGLGVTTIALGLLGVVAYGGDAWARRAKPAKDGSGAAADASGGDPSASKKSSARGSVPAGVTLNACGCYNTGNSCVCTNRNARCDCPEDCEPVGCEQRRQKEMDREIAVETKRAQDDEKKREDAEAARVRKENEALNGEAESASESSEEEAEGLPDPTLEKTAEKTTDKVAPQKPGAQKAAFKAPAARSSAPAAKASMPAAKASMPAAKASMQGKERANAKKVAGPSPTTP